MSLEAYLKLCYQQRAKIKSNNEIYLNDEEFEHSNLLTA